MSYDSNPRDDEQPTQEQWDAYERETRDQAVRLEVTERQREEAEITRWIEDNRDRIAYIQAEEGEWIIDLMLGPVVRSDSFIDCVKQARAAILFAQEAELTTGFGSTPTARAT